MANWIKGAIKHPGALRKELGVKKGENIPKSKLKAAAKKGGKEGERARLAETLSSFKKGGSKSKGHNSAMDHKKTSERDYDREGRGEVRNPPVKVPPSNAWPSEEYVGRGGRRESEGRNNAMLSRHYMGRHARMGK